MPSAPTLEINLASGDELAGRPGGKFVRWALTYGKAIVVITELVVVLAFISRFALDSQIADLNESITKKKDIILASAPFEKEFRSFSTRVDSAQTLLTPLTVEQVLSETKKLIPQGIVINNLGINGKIIVMGGVAHNETELALISDAFRDSPHFSQVVLERVSRGDTQAANSALIAFSLTAQYLENVH